MLYYFLVFVLDRLDEFLNSQHGLKKSRKKCYSKVVKAFENVSMKPFDAVYLDSVEVDRVLVELEKVLAPSSWNEYLVCFKRLAKWLSDSDDLECPRSWRKIKAKHIDWNEKLKGKWLSEEEFLRILEVISSPRDKALFCVCVSGGLRIGELVGLRVGDVEVEGFEIRVTVSGKTGTRSFLMNQFAPVLKHWLNFHPFKHDVNAPLWPHVDERNGGRYRAICGFTVDRMLKRYCKAAGIQKAVSPHWLRHSKVTWTARNRKRRINDKLANAMFGWSPSSNTYSRYTHIHGTDTDDAYRELDGVEIVEKKLESSISRKRCFNCNEWNSPDAMFCFRCGFVLSEDAARRLLNEKKALEYITRKALEEMEKEEGKNEKS